MNKLEKTNFEPDRWPPQAVEILKKMRDDGATLLEIARELGITRSTVSGKIRRLGLPRIVARVNVDAPPKKKQKKYSPKPRRLPPTPPAPEPIPPASDPVPLLELKEWQCRAVLDARGKDQLAICCGRKVTRTLAGTPASWCIEHYRVFTDFERMERRHGQASPRD